MEKEENSITFIDFIALVLRYRILIIAVTLIGTIAFGGYSYKKYTANQKMLNTARIEEGKNITIFYAMDVAVDLDSLKVSNIPETITQVAAAYANNVNNIKRLLDKYPSLLDYDSYRKNYPDLDDEDLLHTEIIKNYFLNTKVYYASNSRNLKFKFTTKDYITGKKFILDMSDECNSYLNTLYGTEGRIYLISSSEPLSSVSSSEPLSSVLIKGALVGLAVSLIISILIAIIIDLIKQTKRDEKAVAKLHEALHRR